MKYRNIRSRKRVNNKTLIVAIDIAKVQHTGYLRCPDGTEVKAFEFFNGRKGFDKLWDRMCKTKYAHNLEEVIVGFESTGVYAEPLLHYLIQKEIKVVQVNPMHTKRLKEIEGNSPNKTDKKDPKVIADIMELGHWLSVVVPEGAAAELRKLTHAREREIERRKAASNQLHSVVFAIFPEFLYVMKGIKTKTALYLLEHYPSPQDIVELGPEKLSTIIKKISRGRLTQERTKALYDESRNSVGVQTGQNSALLDIRRLLDIIKDSNNYMDKLEKQMNRYLKDIPYSVYMLSIKGIGEITVAGLIGEVGDFTKFRTIGEMMKLAGLNLYEISSGDRKGQRRISKRGRPLMRKFLFFLAINAVRKGGMMHERYQRHLQKGMHKMKALIAIARNILSIIFAVVRDHSTYVVDYNKLLLRKAA